LYSDTSSTLAKLADVAVGNALISGGVAAAPSWGKVGLSTHVDGTLPIANGGTNATSAAAALTSLGAYPATNPNGYTTNTGTVTSVGGTGTVNGISLSGTVTTSGSLTLGGALTGVNLTSQVTGTLPVANGGTGQTSYTNGQLLIGNTTGNTLTKATLTQGSGVTITNGAGTITIAATGSGGTVTSVAVSGGTTGLTVSGSPITTSGTITLAGTLAVANGGTGASTLTANNVILGNGSSAVQFVAPSTSGNVLTSNGSTWVSSASTGGTVIPAGTVMIFGQTAAPTGFTKLTNQDNAALRVVSGTASSGGSVNFSTAFASQTPTGSVSVTGITGSAGDTTLATTQIPSHSHTVPRGNPSPTGAAASQATASPSPFNTGNTGGGLAHNHPFSFSSGSATFTGNAINLAVKYVDVIRATKD
jgi:hypothetical protein